MKSPFLLSLSLAAAIAGPGCDDGGVCGPSDAPLQIVAEGAEISLGYQNFVSSANNDCGEPGGPVSLTVEATQVGGDRQLVLCLPRPDELEGEVSADDPSRLRIVDLFAEVDGCDIALDRGRPAEGSLTFSGVCELGADPAGYRIDFDLVLPVTRNCGEMLSSGELTFLGAAAVSARGI